MTESIKAGPASLRDFPELMEMMITSYRTVSPNLAPLESLYPDIYQPNEKEVANIFVIRDAGRIVCVVGLYPLPLTLCGKVVEIGGIGGVCTLPEYRGKNLMRQNLDQVLKVMVERGYPLAWLSGDRQRYRPWGFEICRIKYDFTLGPRGPGIANYLGKISGKIKEGTVDELNWPMIWDQTQNFPELRGCGQEKLRLKYKRIHQKVFMTEGTDGGHIVLREEPQSRGMTAFAGNPQTVASLLAEKIKSDGKDVDAILPAYPNEFWEPIKELMIGYNLAYSGQLSILNLAKTLSTFQPHLNRRVADLGLNGAVKLVLGASRQVPRQEVILEADRRQLHVKSEPKGSFEGPTIVMSCQEAVELLFSTLCLEWMDRLEQRARWVAALMPLPIFIPPIYQV